MQKFTHNTPTSSSDGQAGGFTSAFHGHPAQHILVDTAHGAWSMRLKEVCWVSLARQSANIGSPFRYYSMHSHITTVHVVAGLCCCAAHSASACSVEWCMVCHAGCCHPAHPSGTCPSPALRQQSKNKGHCELPYLSSWFSSRTTLGATTKLACQMCACKVA